MKFFILEKLKAAYVVYNTKNVNVRTSEIVSSNYDDSIWRTLSKNFSLIMYGDKQSTIWDVLFHKSIEPNTSFAMVGRYALTTSDEYLKYKAEKLRLIMVEFKNSNILELGCGFGWNLATLRECGHTGKLIGVDISSVGINLGKQISEKYNLGIDYEELNLIDAKSMNNVGEKYKDSDLIFSYQVIEQLPNDTNVLMARLISQFRKKKFLLIESSSAMFPENPSDLLSKLYVKKNRIKIICLLF